MGKYANMKDKIIFHVHLPANIEKLGGCPVVIGDGNELGEWENNTVKLHRPNSRINPTYWRSEETKLTLSENSKIKYNYAIYIPAMPLIRSKKIIYEGNNSSDEIGKRLLNLRLKHQFDIWMNGNCSELEKYQISEDIPDYAFVDYVYDHVSTQNLKESVLEYRELLTRHENLTIKFSGYEYVIRNFREELQKEQKIFLCLLLGYHISRQDSFILPENFKSELFFNAFMEYRKNLLPSKVHEFMLKAILCLIKHNGFHYKFDWLIIFGIAQEIDPTYSFLEILKDLNYSCSDFRKFSEEMKKIEYCTNDIKYKNTIKIAKWLSKLCNNIESLIEAWNNPLILNEQVNNQILQCFTERIQEIISDDDIDTLMSRSQQLQAFRGCVSVAVRNQALSLIEDPTREWSHSKYAHGILKLFQDDRLNWSSDDIITFLEIISQSHHLDLLNIFPNLLDYWFNQGFSDSRILNISKNWFTQFLDTEDGTEFGEIFVMLLKLDSINPLLGCRENIWENLTNIVADKMKAYTEFQIMNVIKFEPQLKTQEVKELFLDIIKEILDETIQQINDQLIDKILMICGCEGESSLVIPNEICEDIVCYIITRIQDQLLPESDDSEQYLNVIQSIRYNKFLFLILKATGNVEQLYENSCIQSLQKSIIRLNEALLNKMINIQLLQQLLENSDEKLSQHFHDTISRRLTLIVSRNEIAEIRKMYQNYKYQLDQLLRFYSEFCSESKVTDVNDYIHDIQQRMENLNEMKLNQILLPDHWTIHKETLDSERHVYKLIQSQSIQNIFEDHFQKDSDAINVNYITQKLLPIVFENYNNICIKYEEWEGISYSDASKFWKNVKNINAEFDLTEELARRKNPILIQTLEYLLKFPQWVERLERLERFVKIFQIEYNESELSESICTMKSDSLMLGQVIQLIKNIEENFFNNEDYWSLIKELSNDEDLIKNVSKHNIKNLLNVIDDYPDGNLVQYITILSFAQVKQILLPLIDSTMNIGDFIQELSTIIEKNSALSDNITLCNSNNMVLQNMHNKIINLERDIKENVKDAINNGTYIFVRGEKKDECTVTLKLAKVMYDLNYILDLHKKALLNNTDRMNDFTDLVDIIQKIIEILTKLMQGGHFDYQKSEPKIKEIKGMKSMKKWLITTLNNDLERWNNMKNQAQENCYHLTFFTAHHIFAFYNYFTSKVIDEKNRDVCKMLVKFVNGNAKLPSHKKLKELSCDSYDYFSEIGDELENIFRNVSKQRRKINMIQQEVIINDVTSDRSFVVAYDNKLLVPNIIMSLYVNNGYYPEPWQLLLCSSSTTMGELLTFIKRCVFASNNGYNNYLFCIVNLELLNFELQYHLVDYIKEMQLNNLNKNYSLSLLCYQELGTSHYIIDQHSLDVRKINGLNNEMMQEIYRELCPNVLCVTSDLSGQGKTEWIKESSFSKDKIPHSFLISDDMSFEYLVNKLKDCEFKDKESIHINMLPLDHPESVNLFLFKLLTFKIVTYKDLIVSIPETFIYIEIASSIKQNYLPMLGFLPSKHLSWNFEKFKASQEKSSPIQVVCSYLNLYDYGEIDGGVLFNISDVVKNPLPAVFCRNLIMRYFFKSNKNNKNILSFRNIGIFVEVLADQLTRLSSNYYFTINNLENLKDSVDIKPITIKSLIDISKDHATKFIKTKADQLESMNDCLDIISQWDNNIGRSAIIFNSQVSNFLKTLYQDEREASNIVKLLLRSQITNDTMSVDKLYMESMQESSEYALSVDNLIKMGLILLRVHANIPVIICGETGCGKTSLIIYLALISKVQYKVLNLQERIEEETIMKSISEALKKSEEGEFWILFDEINASNHLNLLADLISNRIFRNEPIHPNIRLFATCNPYRICDKLPNNTQYVKKYKERSNLIYQVKPIPNQILDYVWDYGVLKPEDEYEYIQVMVKNELKGLTQPVLVELIFASQKFIRKIEEPYSVSLRDVKRVIRLIKFFYNSLNNRPTYKKGHKYPSDGNLVLINRSYVLALSICYHSRLCEQDLRKQYRYEMGQIFQTHEIFMEEEIFIKIVNEEQEDYINRMQIPNNIIKNEALLENILAIIVCILTKIPIFVIGETGSSKSLALHLISSNLRGLESNNDYFKSLPKVHVVSYLYSSNFTSDGITKIFEKANEYQENNPNIINVVLLDNVGSNSLNSLKLLHTLLEPIYPKTEPTVSFVGLSNWQLDISKSSRSILVQRPKHDLNDLVNINNKIIKFNKEETSEFLAKAYLEYKQHNQALPNFYGLRDYYALLKMLSSSKLTPENIKMALARNFGGIENNVRLYDLWNKYFGNFIKTFTDNSSWLYEQIPITRLIESNLSDSNSRNLMVIGKSETIVNLLTDQLKSKDPIVILGSHFPDDQDDYSFKVLNKIMTCIGTGRPLILTNLERIYAVLYNLWSQNNIVIRNKENTEQDTYNEGSNFMRHISLKCECVVVLDEKNLCSADPSLLNRFEKQKLSIGDYLNEKQQSFVQRLNDWTERISTFEVGSYKFVQKDLFIGFDNDETLQSLVLDITNNYDYDDNEIIENCKRKLVALTTSDGILRAERLNVDSGEINRLKYIYFNQHRDNIYDYFVTLFNRENSLTNSKDDLIIINTFSHVNSDVMSCLRDPITSQAYKLSHLKSEAQLSNIVENFYLKSNYQILILQCDKAVSIECINLAKFIIEKFKNENLDKEQQVKTSTHIKCVCIINHIQRGSEQNLILSNFIHGWKQITIESLEQQNISLSHLLGKSIYDIVNSELFSKIVGSSTPFEKTLEDGLLWCLSCIKYQVSDENCNNYISTLSKGILDNANFVLCMKEKTYKWIFENYNDWQFEIAKNRDYSNEFSCFSLALQNYVKMIIKQIIARILYLLENLSATKTYFTFEKIDDNEMKTDLSDLWKQCFMDNTIINIGNLPEPKPSKYIMSYSVIDELEFPFSYYFFDQINFYKIYYNEELDILRQDLNNIDEETKELHIETIKDHTEGFKNKLLSIKSNFKILQKYSGIYYKDFIKILSNTIEKYESVKELDFIFRNIIEDEVISNPFLLHIYWWRHAESILIQLQLFENFPTIYTKAQKDFHGTLEIFLFNEAIDLILQKIYNNEEYEKEIEIIFSLIIRVNYAKNLTNLPLLYICNELLKIKLIPLEKIKEMIDLGKATEKQEFITVEIIDLVFNILDNNNDLILTNIRSSIMKSLEIIPFKSEVRLILYKNLFSRKPFNLINEIIEKIFIDENQQNDGIFFTLINNPNEALQNSTGLNVINDCLDIENLDTNIGELCCEIIQSIFSKFELKKLIPCFNSIVENAKEDKENSALQQITVISFLKEFIIKTWEYFIHEKNLLSESLIKEINDFFETKHLLALSFKSYFLLQQKRFSINTDQYKIIANIFPWIENVENDTNEEIIYPKFWRIIKQVTIEELRIFYNNNSNLNNYPLLLVYFNHYEKLKLIKHLYPIMKFVKILNSKLEYQNSKRSAQNMTFNEFIKEESEDNTANGNYLRSLFEGFASSWNSVINYIDIDQSKEFSNKPFMNLECSVIYGLVEHKDEGIYLCAILKFLIDMHNELLDNVFSIPVKFPGYLSCNDPAYFTKSIMITQAQEISFVNYKLDEKILKYSRRNLDKIDEISFDFDLQQVEMLLMKELVNNKVYFKQGNNNEFSFRHEIFYNSPRIFFDIRKVLQQEPIKTDKIKLFLAALQRSNSFISELLLFFEIILSFIKKLAIDNNEMLIKDFIQQWLKLSRYNIELTEICEEFSEFSLKHIIELYELIEEHDANSIEAIMYKIGDKFKIPLEEHMKESINDCIDYYNQSELLISAEAFALALKRFIYRYLLIDSNNIENLNLTKYFWNFTLNLWPNYIEEELVKKLFPDCLLVSHAYSSYIYIADKIKTTKEKQEKEKKASFNFKLTRK
ncbi:hypothetical protein RclHR1_03510006 [Rhizophagus clarus]|uniref:AAA+ ATPase domain-containing protein n=1 Tax=Rhizophagus clarus TaxID=94130 RepID=A0A2Z6REH2_9GLOM|nr:hypothetical protein RclHR1_03510006 [Rhizophagus clarus]GES94834.1 hypothetical protein GLOIN_2v1843263 [Rhizophagus clarus]